MFNCLILCKKVRNVRLRTENINEEFIDEKEEGKETREERKFKERHSGWWDRL